MNIVEDITLCNSEASFVYIHKSGIVGSSGRSTYVFLKSPE